MKATTGTPFDRAAAATVHFVDPRVRRLAEAAWRLKTGGSSTDWLILGKSNPEALIGEARDWIRAAVAAGLLPAPDRAGQDETAAAALACEPPVRDAIGRLKLILRSQTHATAASGLRHLTDGNQEFAEELTEVAGYLELIAGGIDAGLLEQLAAAEQTRLQGRQSDDVIGADRPVPAWDTRDYAEEAPRTDAQIIGGLHKIFTGPVEGHDYRVVPGDGRLNAEPTVDAGEEWRAAERQHEEHMAYVHDEREQHEAELAEAQAAGPRPFAVGDMVNVDDPGGRHHGLRGRIVGLLDDDTGDFVVIEHGRFGGKNTFPAAVLMHHQAFLASGTAGAPDVDQTAGGAL